MAENYISTTSLAKKLEVEIFELFNVLQKLKWIIRENNQWQLTEEGKKVGGIVRDDENYGEYITWPDTIPIADIQKELNKENKYYLLSASRIGEKFNVGPQKINLILSELGWIEKDMRGWILTALGIKVGGKQGEHSESGRLYVTWEEKILNNKFLKESLMNNHILEKNELEKNDEEIPFREKFPAEFRTSDGHYVRSRAEGIIDNYLYNNQITHAYERKVPVEDELYCDFYLPLGKKVYIEYWGKEGDRQYDDRKKAKIEIYQKNQLNLVELNDKDILNLDDILPGKLLKYEIKGYM